MRTITLLYVSLRTSGLLGQTVQVMDNSLPGSPVSLKGSVTFGPGGPSGVVCDRTAGNLSTKSSLPSKWD
jgi:hypothetical protein